MRFGVVAQIMGLMAASVLLPAAARAQNVTGAAPATAATMSDTAPRASPNRKYLRPGQPTAKATGSNATATGSRKEAPIEEEGPVDLREAYIATLRGLEDGQPFDFSARSRAIEFANSQRTTLPGRPGTSPALIQLLTIPNWTELGPSPIPNGQTNPVNPVSGRVTAIEVDPTDPNKVYVGTAQGGVYRSLNGGTTWKPMMDGALSLAIGALALDSANGRLYVGTGEANGSGDSFGGVGLYRIDNVNSLSATLVGPINPVRTYQNASNVTTSAAVFTGRSVSKILIVPNDPSTVFVGTAGGVIGIGGDAPFGGTVPPLGLRGLYKLTAVTGPAASVAVTRIGVRDGTGKEGCFDIPCTGNRNVNDMVFDPGDVTGNTLILWLNGGTVALDGGAWRSTNALAATPTFAQSLVTTTSSARAALAVYKQGANPAVIYAATGETNGAMRVSVDGGVTFSAKLAGGAGFCSTQCFYDIALAVLPGATVATNDDKVLLGGAATTIQATSLTGGTTAFVNHQAGLHGRQPCARHRSVGFKRCLSRRRWRHLEVD